jgi:HD superfamily phosphohydrolase
MAQETLDKKNKLISDLCTISQTIDDFIYGPIQISKFASEIINSSEFQRMRNMRQLGVACYIFPNAMHTRFEHSLGTYFQCKELTKRLADVTPEKKMNEYLRAIPELSDYIEKNYKDKIVLFDKLIQETISCACLCHDCGHGCFSHLFDDIFIENSDLKNHENARHERRSQILVEKIIKKSAFLAPRISDEHIKLIQNIIDPSKDHKGFIYQIVSNNLNSLDVDKFDYVSRDSAMLGRPSSFDYKRLISQAIIMNNIIAYPKEIAMDIHQLFHMRHILHRQVYNHESVVGCQLMLETMMVKINQLVDISNSIVDMNTFCQFTDSYIMQFPEFLDSKFFKESIKEPNHQTIVIINEIIALSNRFKMHKFYYPICSFVLNDKMEFDKEKIFKKTFPNHFDDLVIFTSTVGFVSGNKPNPLDNIYLYESVKYTNDKAISIGPMIQKDKYSISNIMPQTYQEYIVIVFFKKNDEQSKRTIIPKIRDYFTEYIEKRKKIMMGIIEEELVPVQKKTKKKSIKCSEISTSSEESRA